MLTAWELDHSVQVLILLGSILTLIELRIFFINIVLLRFSIMLVLLLIVELIWMGVVFQKLIKNKVMIVIMMISNSICFKRCATKMQFLSLHISLLAGLAPLEYSVWNRAWWSIVARLNLRAVAQYFLLTKINTSIF